MDEIKTVVAGENPFKQFGYDVVEPHKREIGERWTDARGKTWEQKSGYRVIVNEKADLIRDAVRQECPKCKKDIRWGNRLDRRFFLKGGMCYDCTINRDTLLMMSGHWAAHEKMKLAKSSLSYFKDIRNQVQESIDYLSTTDGKMHFVDGQGGVETWTNTQVDELLKNAKSDYDLYSKYIKDTEDLICSLEAPKEVNAQ
jgi:hypothetical protein